MNDDSLPGHLSISMIDENVEKVKRNVVVEDRRTAIREASEYVGIIPSKIARF